MSQQDVGSMADMITRLRDENSELRHALLVIEAKYGIRALPDNLRKRHDQKQHQARA